MLDLKLIKTYEDFELFCEELLKYKGFSIESRPARGPGQGKDIICTRETNDEFDGKLTQRFLVECKHFAGSNKSVIEDDIKNIIERSLTHRCDHYLLITSSTVSVTVRDQLEGICRNKDIPIRAAAWYRTDLEDKINEFPALWEKYTGQHLTPQRKYRSFQGIKDFLGYSSKSYPDELLFSEKLYFFSEYDLTIIENIKNIISDVNQRIAVLLGPPASGKSVITINIAKELENQGYNILFHRITSKSYFEDIWFDITMHDEEKQLYIFENCHLNFEIINHIYANYDKIQKAACLFVSRIIPEKLRYTFELDNLDILDNIKDQVFTICVQQDEETKVCGIINNYKVFYEKVYNRPFVIGDEKIFLNNIGSNLLVLHYYLQLWPTIDKLDLIDRKSILQKINSLYLSDDFQEKILNCAVLFQYEIQIEALPEDKGVFDQLLKKGILQYNPETGYFKLYHSDFAKLLIECYTFQPSFSSYYSSCEDFVSERIKKYILSFPNYPSNYDEIIRNLLFVGAKSLIEVIFDDITILNRLITYYTDIESSTHISTLLLLLSRHNIRQSCIIADRLIINNPMAKYIYYKNESTLLPFVQTLIALKKIDLSCYSQFSKIFSEQEIKYLLKRTSFMNIAVIFRLMPKSLFIARVLIDSISVQEIVCGLQSLSFRRAAIALSNFSFHDVKKTRYSISNTPIDFWVQQAQLSFFGDIASAIGTINKIDKDVARKILVHISDSCIYGKSIEPSVTFIGLTRGLYLLFKIDQEKVYHILNNIPQESFLLKAQDENTTFEHLGAGLYSLFKLSPEIAKCLFLKIDLTLIVKKCIEVSLSAFTQSLKLLHVIDLKKAKGVIEKIGYRSIIDRVKKESLSVKGFGKMLGEIYLIDPTIAYKLFDDLDPIYFLDQIGNETIQFAELGSEFAAYNKINKEKAKILLDHVSLSILMKKYYNSHFINFTLGLTAINKVDSKKANVLLSQIDNASILKKIDNEEVNLHVIVHGLLQINTVSSNKARELYKQMDIGMITKKIKLSQLENSSKQQELKKLSSLDHEKTVFLLSYVL